MELTTEYLDNCLEKHFKLTTEYFDQKIKGFVTMEYLDQRLEKQFKLTKEYLDEQLEKQTEVLKSIIKVQVQLLRQEIKPMHDHIAKVKTILKLPSETVAEPWMVKDASRTAKQSPRRLNKSSRRKALNSGR